MSLFVVVCYDIPDDRRRQKVSQTLLGHGARVQRSVFECELSGRDLAKLRRQIRSLLDVKEDLVRYYILCADCLTKVVIEGEGTVYRDPPYYII